MSLFYNETRTHLGLAKDAPRRHAVQRYGDIVTAQFCADCIIATPGYDFREGQLLDNPSPRHLRLRLRSARTAGLLYSFRKSAKKSLCAWHAKFALGPLAVESSVTAYRHGLRASEIVDLLNQSKS